VTEALITAPGQALKNLCPVYGESQFKLQSGLKQAKAVPLPGT